MKVKTMAVIAFGSLLFACNNPEPGKVEAFLKKKKQCHLELGLTWAAFNTQDIIPQKKQC